MSEYVFRVVKAINELDAPVGSQIVYTPLDGYSQIQVVRHMPRGFEPYLLKHYGHLELIDQHPPVAPLSALEHLYRALQIRESA